MTGAAEGGTAAPKPEIIRGMPVEKVGVILVHGIGEQRRFQHLEAETRSVVNAIIANYGAVRRDVTIVLETAEGDSFRGDQSSWISGRRAPLHALVELRKQNKIVDIAFHEVWWADVNEPLTLAKQLRFWLWGLSISGIVTNNTMVLPQASSTRMAIPGMKLTWWQRFRLGFVAALVFISTFSIAWINLILKRLNFDPLLSTGTVVNYMSAVKLYTQTKRAGGSPMDGPDEPPRAAIRRRMVRTIFDVATAGCDRWYILAHSLGSVVAFNAVMETQETLPNYLDRARWDDALAETGLVTQSATPINGNAMLPIRPLWLGDHDVIDRAVLFKTFRGLLTYGCPLERFAGLWGATVPINNNEDVFPSGAEWVNVYDPTDPVGTWLKNFDPLPATPPAGRTTLRPASFPCRASPVLLLSHISYLTTSRRSALRTVNEDPQNLLVNQVTRWLVEGSSLKTTLENAPKGFRTFWMWREPDSATAMAHEGRLVNMRRYWRFAQWVLVGLLLTWLALFTLRLLWEKALPWLAGYVQ